MNSNKKALIAMSGGVDSSVAAYLTKKQGYECIGCTMKLYSNEDLDVASGRTCCSLEDVEDARSVAYKLGMLYYVFNFTDAFEKIVIDKFIKSYEAGITPNPCIDCNRYMKFEKLFERADILGCRYIVTGHYARIEYVKGKYLLKKALDENKDQSYVLYTMTQQQLSRTLFPLGYLQKEEVRLVAAENGFINAQKPDSQDICFVPTGSYTEFIERRTGKTYPHGNFVSVGGNVLGRHKGIVNYTVGQRKGLGVSSAQPLYVTKLDTVDNTVTLGNEQALYSLTASVRDFNWTSGDIPTKPLRCKVKTRYRQHEQWATVIPQGDNAAEIKFDEPQKAITPGQAAVLYDGDTVLGGGVIK